MKSPLRHFRICETERIPGKRSFLFLRWRRFWLWGVIFIYLSGRVSAGEIIPISSQLRALRKQHLIMLALTPPGPGGELSQGHRHYLNKLNNFLSGPAKTDVSAQSTSLFLRGQFYYFLKRFPAARTDFSDCLNYASEYQKNTGGNWPSGLPLSITLKIYRGLSIIDQGDDAVINELEAISCIDEKPLYDDIGELLQEWAEKLAAKGNYLNAIKVYCLIKKFHLWGDDPDEPDRAWNCLKIKPGIRAWQDFNNITSDRI